MSRRHPWMRWVAGTVAAVAAALGPSLRAEEPFDYFRNNWNVIGLKDYARGTRVTPDNRLLLADGEVRLRFGEKETRLSRQQGKTLLEGWLPVIMITAQDGPVRYDFTLWATPLPDVKDWRKAFDWPTEGENFLNWVRVKTTNTGSQAAESAVVIDVKRQGSSAQRSDRRRLAPGESRELVERIPFTLVAPGSPADAAAKASVSKAGKAPLVPEHLGELNPWAKEDADVWLNRTVEYWRGVMAKAAKIETPCRKANEALLAAHVCQLIANDHGVVHGGEGFYDEFYIRDGAYQVMELEEAGLAHAARKAVDHYLRCQRPDGRFESQSNQFDANGQALWTLWQYWKITGDRAWLEKAYPQMVRAVEWIKKARRTQGVPAPADSPFAGVLPVAPADGEFLWDAKHHIVGYDIWNLRGVLCTADAARALGKPDAARDMDAEAGAYRAAIDAAWKRTGLAHFPPSWEKEGTHWGNTETLWPTELFALDDPRVTALIHHARKVQGGGFIEGTIQWLGTKDAIHPYMSAYTTMASLARGEHEQVVEDFYWYLLHSTAAHAFPEGIFYKRRFAWSDTIPHVTGAANYAVMLRHMLVHERGEELHLLRAVPDGWLAQGREIRVQEAPTHFGPMTLRVCGTATGVSVEFSPPKRSPPKRIVLHLSASRPLAGSIQGVEVALRAPQKKQWDFAGVVQLYAPQAPPLFQPIPNLVELPFSPALGPETCRTLDLKAAANTDPLSAPFGVPKPGKFLFTGIPLGRHVLGGVPFEIIDPAANQGRGFVVLHSPRAPKNIQWPTQVEIPVKQQGKRLFFLGNVHGWNSNDQGTGPWGAVAEYVIHYADGQQQVVPLVTGRTADEWTASPEASDVFAALRGDPWHLNVLGVTLRPAPIDKITFRDLGTPAAPVLVAVTIETGP